ncbi:cAMP-binding domain of CRP or a regulatory subunit of cAMP-dependent protein kinases [Lutibacter oricola]|uniref:cAMP-binding domain of CRP or a regulatory subunit of cAMP-dependent protein kinases n=1 Tax=Lutibacter oricola TaxID=762486 RepID=A0A1H2WF25_9FLAO|nr:Crp/Fnr family transcriptional regulator [Lutibacter oricola]SDW79252.1 cAMP-binding domain of CRP or a regulatory subunit of cAMP-dependent protein kinases [Lutibacter oricola]
MPDFLQKETNFDYTFLNAKESLNKLSDTEKNELIEHKTDIEFKAGETIIKRGMLVNNVLYLNSGLVKLEMVNEGKPFTVGLVEPHSFIGIVCCFAFEKFDFTATALEKTKVSFIEKSIFEKFISTNGEFALNLIKHMSGVSNGLLHRITTLSQKNIDGALSLILLDFAKVYNSNSFTIPMVRKDLANMLGYSKESVINTLSKFNKEKIIKVSDRKIEILNIKKLTQISKLG